jgi:cell division protein FtsW
MARTLKSDTPLFLLTVLLLGASLVMVYSASFMEAADRYGSEYYFLYRQLAWAILGFALMWVVMRVDYRRYRKPAVIWAAFGGTLLLLLAVLVVGTEVNGARRWFSLGFLSFQPAEVAKLALVLFTAAVLERRMHRMQDVAATLAPIAIATLGVVLLILKQPDFGTSAVIVCVVLAMVFAAGVSYRHLAVVLAAVGTAGAALVWLEPYRLRRFLSFLDPWGDRLDTGYQAVQSMLAIASGGLLGQGLMDGQLKLYYLPEAHTDFIFAVLAEELGLLGTTLMLGCYAIIAWRGLRIALLAPDRFGSLLALGLTMIIAIQALVNVSVVTVLMPTKGLPLPLVSNGGSSLLVSMVAMGILLNISQHLSSTAVAKAEPRSNWTFNRQEA